MTQIVNLNHLAPDIQESLLFLPVLERGREVVHEKTLRMITSEWNWDRQREMWNGVERRRTKVEPVASGS